VANAWPIQIFKRRITALAARASPSPTFASNLQCAIGQDREDGFVGSDGTDNSSCKRAHFAPFMLLAAAAQAAACVLPSPNLSGYVE